MYICLYINPNSFTDKSDGKIVKGLKNNSNCIYIYITP